MGAAKGDKLDWKRFEDLVGRLESILGNASVKVRINDQIPDKTGELRQIDASVRVTTGTTELLYIIECRNRAKVSDVTWVEQVAKKRDRVRAHKAILVTNKPLTRNATAAAKEEGIDVRTLEQLDASLFAGKRPWMRMSSVRWSPKALVQIRYARTDELSMADYNRIRKRAVAGDWQVRFVLPHHPEPRTMDQIVMEVREELRHESFPPGERGGSAVAEMVKPGEKVELLFEGRRLRLSSLTVIFEGVVEEIEPSRGYFGRYQHPDGGLDRLVAEHAFDQSGEELTFTSVANPNGEGFILNIPPGFGDESVRAQADPVRGTSIEVYFDENGQPILRHLP